MQEQPSALDAKQAGCVWLDSVIKATNINLTKLQEAVEDRRARRALVHGVVKSQAQLNNYINNNK